MKKGEWYRYLFSQIDRAIENEYYFEAAFLCYGIIEDRLRSLSKLLSVAQQERAGITKMIRTISKNRSSVLEKVFLVSKWDGGKYKKTNLLGEAVFWGELYRNPIQHHLGDPKDYKAETQNYHSDNTMQMALEGKRIARSLSAEIFRVKKEIKKGE